MIFLEEDVKGKSNLKRKKGKRAVTYSIAEKEIRKLTAKVIKEMDADIIGLQEVENLAALKKFNSDFLRGEKYSYQIVVDGNDNRFIDVGLLSRYEIDFLRTHQFTRSPKKNAKLFSRDCLEVHIRVNRSKVLPVFINHFKSMGGTGGNGEKENRKYKTRRLNQSKGVINILEERFGKNYGDADFVILGDLNDYLYEGEEDLSGITPLLDNDKLVNVVERLPSDQQWTHYYKGDKTYNQLDYILLSKSLANKTSHNKEEKPTIERRGLPLRVNQNGKHKKVRKFFPEVKGNKKASDHCGVTIKIDI